MLFFRRDGLALVPLLMLGLAANSQPRAESLQSPSGALRSADMADLKPHPRSSKTYNEFWTYQFFLDGNIQAYLNFSRVNLGSFKAPVCGADLSVLGFRGRNYVVAREYKKENFVFTDSLQKLAVHENIWFQGKLPEAHRIHFATVKNGVSYLLDLNFSNIMEGKVWGDGIFHFGSETMGLYINIPYARVTGRLAVNGDTMAVIGKAYMDHTFQTALAPELVRSGYRYIAQEGPLEVGYFLSSTGRFGSRPAGYGLRETKDGVALLKPEALKVLAASRAMGMKVPARLEFNFTDGGKMTAERGQDRLQLSYLHEFSGFVKLAIKKYMGGEIINFKGMGTLNGSRAMGYDYFVVD